MAGDKKEKGKAGRPSLYSEELAEKICELIANDWSVRQIGARDDMPDDTTIQRWIAANSEFASKCARAREQQADFVFGQNAELETKVLSGEVPPDAARVVLSSRQWRAGKLAPKVYGDRQHVEHSGAIGPGPRSITEVVTEIKELVSSDPELQALIKSMG